MRYSNRVGIIFTSVLLALGVVAHGALSGGGGGAAPTPPYDASSPWNTAVSGTPTVDPNSATFMSAISDNLRPLTDDPSQFTPSVEAWDNAHVPSSHQISFTGCAGKHADWINTSGAALTVSTIPGGTLTLQSGSTSGYPSSGSLFIMTDQDNEIRVDYASKSASVFQSLTLGWASPNTDTITSTAGARGTNDAGSVLQSTAVSGMSFYDNGPGTKRSRLYECSADARTNGHITTPVATPIVIPGGTDKQVVLWNTDTGVETGLFQAIDNGDGTFNATNGYQDGTGAGWTGFSFGTDCLSGALSIGCAGRGAGGFYLGGLVRKAEMDYAEANGNQSLHHALAWSYTFGATTDLTLNPACSPSCPRAPATKTDATDTATSSWHSLDGGTTLTNFNPGAVVDPPEGARLQLDPAIDPTTLGLSAAGVVLARTLQTYGAFLIDQGGSTKFSVEYTGTAGWTDANITGGSTVASIPYSDFRIVE